MRKRNSEQDKWMNNEVEIEIEREGSKREGQVEGEEWKEHQ